MPSPTPTKPPRLPTSRILVVGLMWLIILFLFRRGLENFPIDDAYIHLSYATNFGRYGVLGLNPHTVSLGTTSLLWTLLLSPIGYFDLPPYLYGAILTGTSYVLLCFASLALVKTLLERIARPHDEVISIPLWASLIIATHGNILWFASSGMETLLCCAILLSLIVVVLRVGLTFHAWLICCALFLCRPSEGLLVFPIALFSILTKGKGDVIGALFFASTCICYALLCKVIGGHWLPPTMVGKQLTYVASDQSFEAIGKFLFEFCLYQRYNPGSIAILLIAISTFGFIVAAGVKRGLHHDYAPLFLVGTLPLLYLAIASFCFRSMFQLTRYLAVIYPLSICFAVTGLTILFQRKKMLRQLSLGILVALNLSSFNYWRTTSHNQSEHLRDVYIATAVWLRDNTDPKSIIASFDIGTLAYYSEREIIDLGGVTSDTAHFCLKRRDCGLLLKKSGVTHFVSGQDVDTDVYTGLQKISENWPLAANITYIKEFSRPRYPSPTLTNCLRLQVVRINGWGTPDSISALQYYKDADILDYRPLETVPSSHNTTIGLSTPIAPLMIRQLYRVKGVVKFEADRLGSVLHSVICIVRNKEASRRRCVEVTAHPSLSSESQREIVMARPFSIPVSLERTNDKFEIWAWGDFGEGPPPPFSKRNSNWIKIGGF